MKKLLLPLYLLSVVLAGCTSTSKPTMTADQLFQKKQECASYNEKIEKENNLNSDVATDTVEIFYSPLKNSCISFVDSEHNVGFGILEITDILTNQEILGCSTIGDSDCRNIITKKIQALKGE